jgi:predicted alpha-1,2-mannosidase
MQKYIAVILIFLAHAAPAQQLTRFVDPFLGTGGHGHVYPGATIPFGMVQLSPDNGVEGWDWCSGYHYSSNTIAGFSHTHLSGTGIGDWCDISVLPLTNTDSFQNEKIRIPFSHAKEAASPGYYRVKLDNGVQCELTASLHTGHHRYTFPSKEGWLRFDMGFRINWDETTDGELTLVDDYTLSGYRYSTGWAKGQRVHFAARFSSPVKELLFINDSIQKGKTAMGKRVKAALRFDTRKPLWVKVSVSNVSETRAIAGLGWTKYETFENTRAYATELWEKELQKIRINTNDRAFATKFYTALYRTCLAPVVNSDMGGVYFTHDRKLRNFSWGQHKYTIFSQWDVFRALNPLFTITQPDRLPDMLNSMLAFYKDNGLLPVWDISSWEANTMTGYHSIPILADAMLKGIRGFDYALAYQAMKKSAFQQQRGTPDYIRYGYLPQDKHGWSVTITLEYAYDDWCIAQVAKKLGYMDDYALFSKRALSYKALFDPVTGFMRSKDSLGNFIYPFDPLLSEHGFDGQYVEGTAWQHSFFVPHDVEGLAALYGGKEKLVAKLDELFTAPSVLHGDNVSVDVSGLIGQYAHGNEPSHHIIYMYTMLDEPSKAAHWLKVVSDSMYKTGPDGLSGNDDCGQMSAWYIWSCLGMYPMNPASGEYVFGFPQIRNARVLLPNGKTLTISVRDEKSSESSRISKVLLNGKLLSGKTITHQQLLQGGQLVMYVYR